MPPSRPSMPMGDLSQVEPLRPPGQRGAQLVWEFVWAVCAQWTPKPFNPWRLFLLRLFGAKIEGRPFVHQRMRTNKPWNLLLHDRSCVGDRANLYAHHRIELGPGCIVAQEAYLCTAWHDLQAADKTLLARPIRIGADAFVGARAFVLPGVEIGERAVVGAMAVVTRAVPVKTTVVGNPAKPLEVPAP